ncbi:succinate dehydrogenase, hydrophobic membrane anchor protein [Chthonobacter albigriseus]|uniref:succinate dehydrogenase, hydrophobic membrane anchor protein n=1 Tax=Chthonobacter albigriseus TaxID=1683161 RepID=UPI0015EF80D1|nr:succinate dehydrogenase, hydrophobic membrane anchor protein [Chthonobacter albigriseus]
MAHEKSIRTPLARVKGLGSAKEGTEHFWRQRVTALANLPLVIFFVFLIISVQGESHADVVRILAHPFTAIVTLAMIISGVWHMKIGMQVIIEDYVHEGPKLLVLMANSFFCFLVGLAAVFGILKIAFGG